MSIPKKIWKRKIKDAQAKLVKAQAELDKARGEIQQAKTEAGTEVDKAKKAQTQAEKLLAKREKAETAEIEGEPAELVANQQTDHAQTITNDSAQLASTTESEKPLGVKESFFKSTPDHLRKAANILQERIFNNPTLLKLLLKPNFSSDSQNEKDLFHILTNNKESEINWDLKDNEEKICTNLLSNVYLINILFGLISLCTILL